MSAQPSTPSLRGLLGDYLALTKPRILLLLLITGGCAMVVARGALPPLAVLLPTLAGLALSCGGANAINMWYDRDIDPIMARTRHRPIPAGRLRPEAALAFGIACQAASLLLLGLLVNGLAAGLALAGFVYYVFIYTMWLKRRTPQNIVIGGAAGAFPPVIGWAAATGHVGLLPVLLFAIIFFWTPPHFWALSLFASADYQKAGVPMLPVVAGQKATRLAVMRYTLWLVPLSLLPYVLHLAGPVYGASAMVLGLAFVWYSWRVLRDRQDENGVSLTRDAPAKAAFKFSILYLFLIFGALVLDHLV